MKNKFQYHLEVVLLQVLFFLITFTSIATSQPSNGDAAVMQLLKQSLKIPTGLDWSAPNPCSWKQVQCSDDGRVTRIQIGNQGVSGTVPPDIQNLTSLERLELQGNAISGPLPSLSGMSSLQIVLVHGNNFSSIPSDFFSGLTSLQAIDLDKNPLSPWRIPDSIKSASSLQNFSANSVNIVGVIPDVFSPDNFPSLVELHLAQNSLEGPLPASFSGSNIQSLWLNGQTSVGKLNGTINVLQNMTSLTEVWLNLNRFSGPLPDFSKLTSLRDLNLRDNQFTGIVPESLVSLKSLQVVNLTNNLLQGPVPVFAAPSVAVDLRPDSNSFCLPAPGACDAQVMALLYFAKNLGFPAKFAQDWKGNDPCLPWPGISCNVHNVSILNFPKMGLTGTISPDLASLKSLQRIILANNNLYGKIPDELTSLSNLNLLDVSNNRLTGKIPNFRTNVLVKTEGNPDIGKDPPPGVPPGGGGGPSGRPGTIPNEENVGKKSSKTGVVAGSVVGALAVVLVLGLLGLCVYKRKQKRFGRVQSPNAMVVHPRHSGSDPHEMVKITVAGSGINAGSISETYSHASSGPSDIQVVEAGNMVISIQVLRNVTNNFSEANILGRGGFGTVYRGELHDGTKIAVKRMESGVLTEKGLNEFKSEIAVLTKVRHRHLVALLGYCLDGNERLLVYEYMPQGTLSRHLFNWKEENLKPLEWTKRLTIALDVARGVEYLHGLAHQSFIHRDLKPSNILLGDDMRAKVADFGLVRLAPEGKGSIETRLAGTFGYLAPEYAVTGRVTTKADVFSFGVILMELITGRRALDEREPEESMHLVTWFRRMHVNKDTFKKAIDPTIDLTEETLASVSTVAELAGHCCAREPYQRPDMGHTVNVLSSLVELWKPADTDAEDIYGIDLDMTLPQALKKWQAFEGNSYMDGSSSSSFLASVDNTQTSIPTRPSGFADSFTSADGR